MKRYQLSRLAGACLFLCVPSLCQQAAGQKKPIYFNFFQHLDDHINPESARAGARVAELYAKYGIKAGFYPIGISQQMYDRFAPETAETLKRLEMPICYHGVTHYRFPVMRERIGDKDWDEAVEEAIYCETYRLNVLKAAIDESQPGGIALIDKIYGASPILAIPRVRAGSVLHAYKKMGVKMLSAPGGPMLGWPMVWRLGMLGGLSGPGNYALNANLLTSQIEASEFGPRTVWEDVERPSDAVTVVSRLIERLPRDRVNLLSFGWHPFQFVIKSGGRPGWGGNMYRDVRSPSDLPDHHIPAPIFPPEKTDEVFAIFEELIKFVANHPELTPVTCTDLLDMVEPLPENRLVSRRDVIRIAGKLVEDWVNFPPEHVSAGGAHYSLADAFQAVTAAVAGYAAAERIPAEVEIREILGPTHTPVSLGLPYRRMTFMDIPRTSIPGVQVVRTAAAIAPKITDRIPSVIYVAGRELRDRQAARKTAANVMDTENIVRRETSFLKSVLNPAEFLYIASQALLNIDQHGNPGDVLLVAGSVVPGGPDVTDQVTKQQWHSYLQQWTVKPATLKREFQWLLE